jgi:hypothetical protein
MTRLQQFVFYLLHQPFTQNSRLVGSSEKSRSFPPVASRPRKCRLVETETSPTWSRHPRPRLRRPKSFSGTLESRVGGDRFRTGGDGFESSISHPSSAAHNVSTLRQSPRQPDFRSAACRSAVHSVGIRGACWSRPASPATRAGCSGYGCGTASRAVTSNGDWVGAP